MKYSERIDFVIDEILDQYMYADKTYRPWIIGFSGGKDSTVLLTLTWLALKKIKEQVPVPFQLRRPIYVVCNDTLVENPIISSYVDDVLEQIQKAAREQDLPIFVKKTIPRLEDSFWVNVIGKGYPVPNTAFRWCTEKMKIKPTARFITEQVDECGEAIVLIGTRKAESATRARSIKKHEIHGQRLTHHTLLKNTYVYAPIKELMLEEIWYINTLFMRLDMAKSRNIPLKQNVMAKLMLIEYFCNPFYMLVMDGKNKEDFAKFENGKFEGIFKDYSNDEWILEWNKIQCKLSKEDLRDYYYYSNSRFAYSQSVSTMLSPKARKCLENFQAKSEILRREAVKILDELSLAERKIIAKTLYDAMKTDGKLEQDIFKSYVKVIDSKDMITDALVQIKSIPAYCYTKGQITLIANLQSMSQFLSPEEKVELKTHLGEDYVKLQNITGSLKKK